MDCDFPLRNEVEVLQNVDSQGRNFGRQWYVDVDVEQASLEAMRMVVVYEMDDREALWLISVVMGVGLGHFLGDIVSRVELVVVIDAVVEGVAVSEHGYDLNDEHCQVDCREVDLIDSN